MNKVITDISVAFKNLKDGDTILAGGFGLCGIPEHSINHIKKSNVKNLTIVSNNCGIDGAGLGLLLENDQVRKLVASYVGENKLFEQKMINEEIEVVLTPQGTLAEQLRAGGSGIGGFYTRTGLGTLIAQGKDTKTINGLEYILELAIRGEFGIIKAKKADRFGNVVFNKTARNFNPLCAMAAATSIVEVEEVVEHIDADSIHLPGIYIDYVYCGKFNKQIEKTITRD